MEVDPEGTVFHKYKYSIGPHFYTNCVRHNRSKKFKLNNFHTLALSLTCEIYMLLSFPHLIFSNQWSVELYLRNSVVCIVIINFYKTFLCVENTPFLTSLFAGMIHKGPIDLLLASLYLLLCKGLISINYSFLCLHGWYTDYVLLICY